MLEWFSQNDKYVQGTINYGPLIIYDPRGVGKLEEVIIFNFSESSDQFFFHNFYNSFILSIFKNSLQCTPRWLMVDPLNHPHIFCHKDIYCMNLNVLGEVLISKMKELLHDVA